MNWLTGLLVPIAVAVVFALARKRLAACSMKRPEGESRYIPFGGTWGVNTCIIIVGVLFALSTHTTFVWLSHYIAAARGPAELWLWPDDAIWWFFPLFGALSLSWEIVLRLWSSLGNRANAYSYSYSWAQTAGFDSTRMLRWMAIFITLPIGVLTMLALPMHVALNQSEIRDCGYASTGCRVYRYADVRQMTAIEGFRDRRGVLVSRAGIVIDFSDGRRWSSAEIGDVRKGVDPELAAFLEKKTHLPINRAETEADIPDFASSPK